MHLPMLLKLGTKVMNDGLHKHVILLFKRVANLFLVMHGPILFKRGISRVHDSIHLHHQYLGSDQRWPTGRLTLTVVGGQLFHNNFSYILFVLPPNILVVSGDGASFL